VAAAPALTRLRRAGPGRVALEVDGRPWRTVPDVVVARAGLTAGLELDRPTLRRVRTELARARAGAVAGRALARRDLTVHELEERLERAGVPVALAGETTAAAVFVGVVDDERFARRRAEQLAERGYGDAAIAARLEAAGVAEELVRAAVEALESEPERARRLADGGADPRKTVQLLARRGFDPDTIEEVAGPAANGDA
jgi:SOS response regulatory protein OraA/RecX